MTIDTYDYAGSIVMTTILERLDQLGRLCAFAILFIPALWLTAILWLVPPLDVDLVELLADLCLE